MVGGPHLSADPVQSDPHLCVPSLRAVLQTNRLDQPSAERARPLSELLAELVRIEPFHQACDYLTVGKVLPELLDELHVHVAAPEDEVAERGARQGLVQASVIATFVAKDLGHNDLGYVAATRAAQAADRADYLWVEVSNVDKVVHAVTKPGVTLS